MTDPPQPDKLLSVASGRWLTGFCQVVRSAAGMMVGTFDDWLQLRRAARVGLAWALIASAVVHAAAAWVLADLAQRPRVRTVRAHVTTIAAPVAISALPPPVAAPPLQPARAQPDTPQTAAPQLAPPQPPKPAARPRANRRPATVKAVAAGAGVAVAVPPGAGAEPGPADGAADPLRPALDAPPAPPAAPPPAPAAPAEPDLSPYGTWLRRAVVGRLEYPAVAERNGWEGVTVVVVGIRRNGSVAWARVDDSSGRTALDDAALAAVTAAAPFQALPAGVRAAVVEFAIPVRFSLDP